MNQQLLESTASDANLILDEYEQEIYNLMDPETQIDGELLAEMDLLDETKENFKKFSKVMKNVSNQLESAKDQVKSKIDQFRKSNINHTTFGQEKKEKLTVQQSEEIENLVSEQNMNLGINMDDTMCLIHSITQLKTHNFALQARIKELEAQVKA